MSPEELAKHNTESDCWIAYRGLVYNVTPYMDFHPGGAEELMRAAGTDGTQLFDEVRGVRGTTTTQTTAQTTGRGPAKAALTVIIIKRTSFCSGDCRLYWYYLS